MKRILILALILLAAIPTVSAAKDRVLIVYVRSTGSADALDQEVRHEMAIKQIMFKRDLMYEEYKWGNKDTLKAKLTSGRYKVAIISGGRANGTTLNTGSTPGDIKYFWGLDSTYCTTPTIVWYATDCRIETGVYVNGTKNAVTALDRYNFQASADTMFLVNGSSVLDTAVIHMGRSDNYMTGARQDSTINNADLVTTPILRRKFLNGATQRAYGQIYLFFWKVRYGTQVKYYTELPPGTSVALIDAIVCKYCPTAKPIQYCLTMDDFGSFRQAVSDGTNTREFFPWTGTYQYTSRFFTEINNFLDMIRSYNSKMTIGATPRYWSGTTHATNQHESWISTYQNHIAPYYGTNFSMVWHDHGRFNGAWETTNKDSLNLLMPELSSLHQWSHASGRWTVYPEDMDSLYGVWADSMTSYGIKHSPGIIPPGDAYEGYGSGRSATSQGTFPHGYLGDTILAFCAMRDQPIRIARNYSAAGGWLYRYGSSQIRTAVWNDSRIRLGTQRPTKLVFEQYATASDSLPYTGADKRTAMAADLGAIWGLKTIPWEGNNLNQGQSAMYNNALCATYSQEFSGMAVPCLVYHVGYLYTTDGTHKGEYKSLETLLKHLAWFDELAGRQIYEPVLLNEFDWNNVMRSN
jgi:hypothetical protein